MKRVVLLAAIATAIGSLMACGGSPTAPTAAANIAGTYNASITASSTCSTVPAGARVLDYFAQVSQTGTTAQIQIDPHGGTSVTVAGSVSGQTVTFPSLSFSGSTAGVGVSIAATTGKGNIAANGEITGTLSGTYQTAAGASCNADHQLQMRRCVNTCSGNICACL